MDVMDAMDGMGGPVDLSRSRWCLGVDESRCIGEEWQDFLERFMVFINDKGT